MEWTHCIRALVSLAWGSPQTTIWPVQESHPVSEREKIGPRSARTSLSFLHPPSVPKKKGKDSPQPPGGFIRFNAWQTETCKPHTDTDTHTKMHTSSNVIHCAGYINLGEGYLEDLIILDGTQHTKRYRIVIYMHSRCPKKVDATHINTHKHTCTHMHTQALTSIHRQT